MKNIDLVNELLSVSAVDRAVFALRIRLKVLPRRARIWLRHWQQSLLPAPAGLPPRPVLDSGGKKAILRDM